MTQKQIVSGLPYADLEPTGNPAVWRGRLFGHPADATAETTLEVQSIGDTYRRTQLFYQPHEDCDAIPIGEGIMRRQPDGSWRGHVMEFIGHWVLYRARGSDRVEFREGRDEDQAIPA